MSKAIPRVKKAIFRGKCLIYVFTILKCLFRGLVIGMGILFKVIWMGLLYSLKVAFIMSKAIPKAKRAIFRAYMASF